MSGEASQERLAAARSCARSPSARSIARRAAKGPAAGAGLRWAEGGKIFKKVAPSNRMGITRGLFFRSRNFQQSNEIQNNQRSHCDAGFSQRVCPDGADFWYLFSFCARGIR